MHRLKADTPVDYRGCRIVLPKGTPVIPKKDGMGHTLYAVRDAKLVKQLTGDTFSPTYYYCWVPAEAVEGSN